MKSSRYNFSWLLDEEEYEVHFLYYPPCRGVREKGTGLPLSPDDEAEVEITAILDSAGVDYYGTLLSLYKGQLEEKAWEYLEKLKNSDY